MTEPDPAELALDTARQTYPVGDHVTGKVTLTPRPGAVGLFVDLGRSPTGFVDVLHLPQSVDQWPGVGTVTDFEVLQHRHHQVRLWPLDNAFRSSTTDSWRSEPGWQAVKHRYPVCSEVIAEITDVFPSNREYVVTFGGIRSVLAWTGTPPVVGANTRFVVARHLDTTRRVLLRST
ncbi:hypothetical protein L6E12_33715 [Actinokineospora sp. PR83]|uniref:hypothetical protein n=1 Tax=Actinokineospora sp. PR83 TaxID=2884908 RepID=UPI001F44F689|nr:hypothetical protein [Actinokineospora sp. PR83]MCG8920727.1 hypothetical protein [Actinokineospora sp. PR83]